MAKVLLVDDEMTMIQMVGELLRSEGHQVVPFTSFPGAGDSMDAIAPALVIANFGLERNGPAALNILQKARSLNPPPLTIMVTSSASAAANLECVKRGAYDCLSKPFTPEELKLRVQRALSYQAAVSENATLRKQLQSRSQPGQIIGASPEMQEVSALINRLADTDSVILITGPDGSGKHFVARTIHSNSRRRFAPFVAIDCGSLPENLIEVELFGQRKSPFVPSRSVERGLFRDADGGTVLLDNVGSLTPPLQSRLLTLLQQRHILGQGDSTPVAVDVRILAASQEPLEENAARGELLRDLCQQLSEFRMTLPPLRERGEDIPLLISHLLGGRIHPRSRKPCDIEREAVEACRGYHWPGNVRELENALHHACVVCQTGVIQREDLPRALQQHGSPDEDRRPPKRQGSAIAINGPQFQCGTAQPVESLIPAQFDIQGALVPLKRFLRDQEISYLQRTLAQVGGSKERAAEVLGISLATMYRKLSEPAEVVSESI